MVHFVAAFRDLLYHATIPSVERIGVMLLSAGGALLLGWSLFNRMSPRLPEEV